MNDKLNLEVTIKPALTVERIREELADMVGLKLNPDTNAEIVRRLNAMGLFDFGVQAKPTHSDECLMLDTSHLTEADIEDLKAKFRSTSRCGQPPPVLADRQHVVELPTMSQVLGPLPADQRETAANVLLMCKLAVLDSGAAVKMGAWTEGDAALAELVEQALQDADSGKTYTHEEAKRLMAERRAKVAASKPTCTDERPCVNCFSGQGECEVGPFGGPELLEQARALCQAIERLPAGEHQTNLISKVADATFALQNLQSTGNYFWPRPVAPSLLDTSRISAEDLEALKAKLMSLRDNGGIMTPVLAAPMLTQAAQSVLAERRRQVEVEGRTPESDDQYAGGQLAFAAIAYLMVGVNPNGAAQWWPWDAKTFKPSPDTRRNLVKAGALLLADIEWVDRRQAAATPVPDDLTQFLEQTDFDAAEKVASEKADAPALPTGGEDDCEGCKI